MNHFLKPGLRILLIILLALPTAETFAQNNTQIRGFVDVSATYSDDKVSFGLGEQDLFITSDLNDRFSFLGETVFKFDPESETQFSVSIERIVLKYNYKGNHNILIGKHHTPINYWNDTYHHGRVFFPTTARPLVFASELFPLHTTGISFQGLNLGSLKFGYDLMVGNGIGSTDVLDLDKGKSVTAAIHIKPRNALRIGLSYYYDRIPGESREIIGQSVIIDKCGYGICTTSDESQNIPLNLIVASDTAFEIAATLNDFGIDYSWSKVNVQVVQVWI